MDNPRILPPMVRGKVTGVLNFFIDEIVIRRNLFHLTENLDIFVQVQWWGEILPASIRPSVLLLEDRISNSKQLVENFCHSVHYEIKTTMELLKSYLRACEVLELVVCEAVENNVIGSAFLRDLSNLLNKNHDFIVIPIFDYIGEEIGQIKIRFDFFEYPQKKKNCNVYKSKTSDTNLDALEIRVSELLKNNYIFPAEKTIFYDGHSNITNVEIRSDDELGSNKFSNNDENNTASIILPSYTLETREGSNISRQTEDPFKCVALPKVSVLRDSSKVLNFDLDLKTGKTEKNNKSNLPKRFTSTSIKCKNKPKLNLEILKNREKCSKKTVPPNLVVETSSMRKTNPVYSERMPSSQQSTESFSKKHSEVETTSQTSANKMIFDYLLGSVMSKENEETALKDFKEMSPSQNIVSTINELCLTSEKSNVCATNRVKHNLCFDLANPIERSYYEMFFVKNDSNDLDITELLNEPQNFYGLQKGKTNDSHVQKGSFKIHNSSGNDVIKKCDDFLSDDLGEVNKIRNGCNTCKYSKKLDELDTIIESLKHFEKKMLKQEKKLQLELIAPICLNKQVCKKPDR